MISIRIAVRKLPGALPILFAALFMFFSNISFVEAQSLSPEQLQTLQSGILYFNTDEASSCSSTNNNLVGSDNEQKAFNFFLSQGLSDTQTAAVVGNLMDESGLDPTAMQKGGDSQNPYDAGALGWGIAQWTGNHGPTSTGDKVTAIYKSSGVSGQVYELATQLNMVWWEMNNQAPTGYQNLASKLKQINDLATAVTFFQQKFEGGVAGSRQKDAQQAMQLYGSGSPSTSSGTTSTSSCSSVTCSTTSNSSAASDISSSGLSQTRQNVVCLAEQELALWSSQPGYPWACSGGASVCTNSYSESAYQKYSAGSAEEWCADFVSWIYNQAQYPFTGGYNGGWRISYVPNIQALGEQNGSFQWHPASSGYTPNPGDIAIHGSGHVNIFISSSGGVSTYIGGDQGHGPYPGGSIVSTDIEQGYYGGGITGYVSPD